jgi:hypothetical protein
LWLDNPSHVPKTMAKGKNRKHRDDASVSSGKVKEKSKEQKGAASAEVITESSTVSPISEYNTYFHWLVHERPGYLWVLGCAIAASLFGFSVGTGQMAGAYFQQKPGAWGIALGQRLRESYIYQSYVDPLTGTLFASSDPPQFTKKDLYTVEESSAAKFRRFVRSILFERWSSVAPEKPDSTFSIHPVDSDILALNPSHPNIYAVLREAIIREKGGYVYPDLGILQPAPCGAARGIGMVRNLYYNCQSNCIPGLAEEKLHARQKSQPSHNRTATISGKPGTMEKRFMQEEVLIKVPLSFQMTRKVALDTLLPLIPAEVQKEASLHELDDAALLVLLLAHERGIGEYSRWLPYIASLPLEPSCGYSLNLRPHILDAINAMREELGMDVNGWENEMLKATQYADKIAKVLAHDYGEHIQCPDDESPEENLAWALCQVASRATGGSQKHGALRMIPLLDMINHDVDAGGFVELTGLERLEEGDFVDAVEETDEGAFVVRSLRHGRRKALRPGQELLVNYNVPHYSALDWFVSLGFVPPERYEPWQKMDSPLPRIRQDGPFALYLNKDYGY